MSFQMEYDQAQNIQVPDKGYFDANLYFDNELMFRMGCCQQIILPPEPMKTEEDYKVIEVVPTYYITAKCAEVHDKDVGEWHHPIIIQTTCRDNFMYQVWRKTMFLLVDRVENLPTYITAEIHSEGGDWKSSRYVDRELTEDILGVEK